MFIDAIMVAGNGPISKKEGEREGGREAGREGEKGGKIGRAHV